MKTRSRLFIITLLGLFLINSFVKTFAKDYTFCFENFSLTLYDGGLASQIRYGIGGTIVKSISGEWEAFGNPSDLIKIKFSGSTFSYTMIRDGFGSPSVLIDKTGRRYTLCKSSQSNSTADKGGTTEVLLDSQPINTKTSETIIIGNLEIMKNDLRYTNMTWDDAIGFCNGLGKDWHLPSIDELIFLYNNCDAIGGFDKTNSYWSSNKVNIKSDISNNIPDQVGAYVVNFGNGEMVKKPFYVGEFGGRPFYNRFNVRAVRVLSNEELEKRKKDLEKDKPITEKSKTSKSEIDISKAKVLTQDVMDAIMNGRFNE